MSARMCIDCAAEGIERVRPAPYGGPRSPRCASHERARKKRARSNAHARMTERVYNLTGEQYRALYEAQGGHCAICWRATGKTKSLAVDHDHETGLVRGLLCGPDNRDVVGRLDIPALIRAAEYLAKPPAFEVIGKVMVP